jgi:hypothetical protein
MNSELDSRCNHWLIRLLCDASWSIAFCRICGRSQQGGTVSHASTASHSRPSSPAPPRARHSGRQAACAPTPMPARTHTQTHTLARARESPPLSPARPPASQQPAAARRTHHRRDEALAVVNNRLRLGRGAALRHRTTRSCPPAQLPAGPTATLPLSSRTHLMSLPARNACRLLTLPAWHSFGIVLLLLVLWAMVAELAALGGRVLDAQRQSRSTCSSDASMLAKQLVGFDQPAPARARQAVGRRALLACSPRPTPSKPFRTRLLGAEHLTWESPGRQRATRACAAGRFGGHAPRPRRAAARRNARARARALAPARRERGRPSRRAQRSSAPTSTRRATGKAVVPGVHRCREGVARAGGGGAARPWRTYASSARWNATKTTCKSS